MFKRNLQQEPGAVAKSLEHLDPSLEGVRGIVVNRVSKSLLGGLYTSHHFYAVIPFAGPGAKAAGETAATGERYPTGCRNGRIWKGLPPSRLEAMPERPTFPMEWGGLSTRHLKPRQQLADSPGNQS